MAYLTVKEIYLRRKELLPQRPWVRGTVLEYVREDYSHIFKPIIKGEGSHRRYLIDEKNVKNFTKFYNKQKHPFDGNPVLLVSVRKTYRKGMTENDVLKITCGSWKLRGHRKDGPRYAFAVYSNEIKGVFTILSWSEDKQKPGRLKFKGEIAEPQLHDKYIGTSVKQFRKKKESTPFMYVNC